MQFGVSIGDESYKRMTPGNMILPVCKIEVEGIAQSRQRENRGIVRAKARGVESKV